MDLIRRHILRFLKFRDVKRASDDFLVVLGFLHFFAFGCINSFPVVISPESTVDSRSQRLDKLTTALYNPVTFATVTRFLVFGSVMTKKIITGSENMGNVLSPLSVTTQLN